MKLITIVLFLFAGINVFSQTTSARQKHFNVNDDHLAIEGYDPVSYFTAKVPTKGKKSIPLAHNGITYLFSTTANRDLFKENPNKYEPAWGGWCGHAMALRGEKVAINPLCYKIVDGRNVLFYRTVLANALTNWNEEIAKTKEPLLMKMGDDFWKTTLK